MTSEQHGGAKAERQAKLAEALRANLRRRKARARDAAEANGTGDPPLALSDDATTDDRAIDGAR